MKNVVGGRRRIGRERNSLLGLQNRLQIKNISRSNHLKIPFIINQFRAVKRERFIFLSVYKSDKKEKNCYFNSF